MTVPPLYLTRGQLITSNLDDEGGPVYRVVNNRIYVYGVITPRQDMAKCAWRSSPQIAATSLYNNEEELSNMLNSCEGACDNMYYS